MGLEDASARGDGSEEARASGAWPGRAAPSYQRLLLPWRPVEVQRRLEERLRRPVALAVTANRSRLIRVLPETGRTSVRLHSMFLYAPTEVLDALARYARRPQDLEANEVLDAFIRGEAHRTLPGPERPEGPRPRPLPSAPEPTRSRGERFDLQEIMDAINRTYFEGTVVARITWSRGVVQRRRRSILFGSYQREPGHSAGLIKIHPALDEEWVPRGFVEFVVHHELLHAVIPTRIIRGRHAFHPPDFRRRERAYPGYAQWRRWEKDNLGRFLGKTSWTGADPGSRAAGDEGEPELEDEDLGDGVVEEEGSGDWFGVEDSPW